MNFFYATKVEISFTYTYYKRDFTNRVNVSDGINVCGKVLQNSLLTSKSPMVNRVAANVSLGGKSGLITCISIVVRKNSQT